MKDVNKYLAYAFLVLGVLGLFVGVTGRPWFLIIAAVWFVLAFGYAWNYRHPKSPTGQRDSIWTAHQKRRAGR